jgi:FAD binding domain
VSALARGVELDRRAVDDLATSFGGSLIRPDDPTYDEQRLIWNGSIDRRPGLIARCAGVADVISAVRVAREHEQLVAVRSGGHSYPGLCVCDRGMVIDLGQMKGIRVDPEARTARAQAGVLLGDLDREAQAFGLAVPAGIVTHTGLAGVTLGGVWVTHQKMRRAEKQLAAQAQASYERTVRDWQASGPKKKAGASVTLERA